MRWELAEHGFAVRLGLYGLVHDRSLIFNRFDRPSGLLSATFNAGRRRR
jgi:hypothetical protein